MPVPNSKSAPPRIVIQLPSAGGRRRALPREARRGRHGRTSPPTSSATATRSCAPWSATRRPAAAAGSNRRCARWMPTSTASAGRATSTSTRWAAGSGRSRPGATSSRPGATSSSARSAPPRTTSPASCPRASCCSSRPRAAPRAPTARRSSRRSRRCAPAARPTSPSPPTCSPRWSAPPSARARRASTRRSMLEVDRVPAAFAAWYELFPRSWGGLQGVEKQIPAIAELGFDVLYFTPIHPIGVASRKGRNNTLTAGPEDPGSPYAIGGSEGGHDAVHPELGTMARGEPRARERLRRRCRRRRAADARARQLSRRGGGGLPVRRRRRGRGVADLGRRPARARGHGAARRSTSRASCGS